MVPIPHGVGEHGLAGGVVEFLKPLGGSPARPGLLDLLGLVLAQQGAGDPAAVLHQGGAVDLGHLLAVDVLGKGLDDLLVRVVDEDHDVGQFDGAFSRTFIRGDPGQDGALGGPDGGAGALLIAVLFQVQLAQQAQAGLAVGQLPLDEDHGVLHRAQALFL